MTGRGVRCIWNAAKDGQIQRAMELDRQNTLFLARIYNRLCGPVQNIAGQKFALKLMGLISNERAMVDQPLNAAARDRTGRALVENQEWLA